MTDAPQISAPTSFVEATRWLAVGSLLALIALGLWWELRVVPSWWAVKVLPLCLPLAGLLKRRVRTYQAMTLAVWIWFTDGVVQAWTERGAASALALAEVALSLLLFAACVLHVRARARAHAQSQPQPQP
jgi:uncharacterized membrane protein